jgi:hypothetical protein
MPSSIPCAWESDHPCTGSAAPDSVWCDRHTALAFAAVRPPSVELPPSLNERTAFSVQPEEKIPSPARADDPPPSRHSPERTYEPEPETGTETEDYGSDDWRDEVGDLCPGPNCHLCQHHRCHALARDQTPCSFPSRAYRPYCINHDPVYYEQQRENARRAGIASGFSRSPVDLEAILLYLGDRAGIQAAIDLVVRLELSAKISPARSRNILRALSIASRNFDRNPCSPARHDHNHFSNLLEQLDRIAADVLADARANDAAAAESNPRPVRTPEPRRLSLTDLWSALR